MILETADAVAVAGHRTFLPIQLSVTQRVPPSCAAGEVEARGVFPMVLAHPSMFLMVRAAVCSRTNPWVVLVAVATLLPWVSPSILWVRSLRCPLCSCNPLFLAVPTLLQVPLPVPLCSSTRPPASTRRRTVPRPRTWLGNLSRHLRYSKTTLAWLCPTATRTIRTPKSCITSRRVLEQRASSSRGHSKPFHVASQRRSQANERSVRYHLM